MSTVTLTQEKEKIKSIINSYKSEATRLQTEINGIEEKYKRLAEQEKAALVSAVDFYEAAINAMAVLVNMEEVKAKAETEIKVDEDVVVDNLFPENNVEEKEDTVVEEEVAEEDNLELEELKKDDSVLDFEKENTDEEVVTEETIDDDPNQFPDTVEEWL